MGYALALELAEQGAKVKLVSGPTHEKLSHSNIEIFNVISAEEMFNECKKHFPKVAGAILAAAVADFTPMHIFPEKIKGKENNLFLELKPTADIAAFLGKTKNNDQLLVGFALETENEIENAKVKLKKKNFDFIVLNSLQDAGAGFNFDTNKITILTKSNNVQHFELKSKIETAKDIVAKVIEHFCFESK